MSTLTEFGKALRKLRIDHDLTLKNLSDKLSVTSAYLSGVETGRKSVNAQLIEKISEQMSLSVDEVHSLTIAASKVRPEVTMKPNTDFEAEVALMFARRLHSGLDLTEVHKLLRGQD